MSALTDLLNSKSGKGAKYTGIEILIMTNRRKFPDTCEEAAHELADMRAELAEAARVIEPFAEQWNDKHSGAGDIVPDGWDNEFKKAAQFIEKYKEAGK